MTRRLAAFVLSAILTYLLVQHELRPPTVRRLHVNPSPDLSYAVGGLLPVSEIHGGDETLRHLYVAHCVSPDSPKDVAPEELTGLVAWKRGTPVTVICPETGATRREALGGFEVTCGPERADLYVKLGRERREEMVGCLVILGASDATPTEPDVTVSTEGVRGAFLLRDRTYLWTERSDGTGGVVDEVRPAPTPAS